MLFRAPEFTALCPEVDLPSDPFRAGSFEQQAADRYILHGDPDRIVERDLFRSSPACGGASYDVADFSHNLSF